MRKKERVENQDQLKGRFLRDLLEENNRVAMSYPGGPGWLRLIEVLTAATKDNLIMESSGASGFLFLMLQFANASKFDETGVEQINFLLASVKTVQAKKAVAVKNEKRNVAMHWTQEEWDKHRAAYKDNKSEFSIIYSKRIHNELQVEITVRTIRERWLKGR